MLDIILIIIAFASLLVGILGSILPALPGPPLSYVGLLILYFLDKNISTSQLIVWGIIVIVVSLLDYFLSPIITKKYGGSKSATYGSIIGVILCMLVFPISIFLGAFLGAMIGELIHNPDDKDKALRVGLYSFLGFVTGTFMKVIICVIMLIICIFAMF